MKMGIYIYGIKKRTRKHPFWGEVGVLRFIHKPAGYWADERSIKADRRRENYYIKAWQGKELPKVVCYEEDDKMERLHFYFGGPTWVDADESSCIPFDSVWGKVTISKLQNMNSMV